MFVISFTDMRLVSSLEPAQSDVGHCTRSRLPPQFLDRKVDFSGRRFDSVEAFFADPCFWLFYSSPSRAFEAQWASFTITRRSTPTKQDWHGSQVSHDLSAIYVGISSRNPPCFFGLPYLLFFSWPRLSWAPFCSWALLATRYEVVVFSRSIICFLRHCQHRQCFMTCVYLLTFRSCCVLCLDECCCLQYWRHMCLSLASLPQLLYAVIQRSWSSQYKVKSDNITSLSLFIWNILKVSILNIIQELLGIYSYIGSRFYTHCFEAWKDTTDMAVTTTTATMTTIMVVTTTKTTSPVKRTSWWRWVSSLFHSIKRCK